MKTVIIYENSWIDYGAKPVSSSGEDIQRSIEYWWLELNENGVPIRELGFDINDQVKYAAPKNKDRGLWTDSMTYFKTPEEYVQVNNTFFEEQWRRFNAK
ncbi:MAG: hypothetical protein DRI69_08205 [Bacteroidetes bacterium]|nr:MAG: hypothetical protein DRI69_08205 [Bacteroidota bacterium]